MSENRLVILDLDRTLFDSDRFYADVCRVLKKAGRINSRQLAEAISILSDPESTPYITDLVKKFRVDEAGIEELLMEELKLDAYLYPDVGPFLRRADGCKIVIVTTGVVLYQKLKFSLSPQLKEATHRIISQINKGVYIKKRLNYKGELLKVRGVAEEDWYSGAYFIDDRNYNLNVLATQKQVKLFHIRRPEEKIKSSSVAPTIRAISSLHEVRL